MRTRTYLQAIVRKATLMDKPITLEHRDLHEEVLAAFVADPDIRYGEALEVVELVQAGKAEKDGILNLNRSDRIGDIAASWEQDPNLPEVVQRVQHVARLYRN